MIFDWLICRFSIDFSDWCRGQFSLFFIFQLRSFSHFFFRCFRFQPLRLRAPLSADYRPLLPFDFLRLRLISSLMPRKRWWEGAGQRAFDFTLISLSWFRFCFLRSFADIDGRLSLMIFHFLMPFLLRFRWGYADFDVSLISRCWCFEFDWFRFLDVDVGNFDYFFIFFFAGKYDFFQSFADFPRWPASAASFISFSVDADYFIDVLMWCRWCFHISVGRGASIAEDRFRFPPFPSFSLIIVKLRAFLASSSSFDFIFRFPSLDTPAFAIISFFYDVFRCGVGQIQKRYRSQIIFVDYFLRRHDWHFFQPMWGEVIFISRGEGYFVGRLLSFLCSRRYFSMISSMMCIYMCIDYIFFRLITPPGIFDSLPDWLISGRRSSVCAFFFFFDVSW